MMLESGTLSEAASSLHSDHQEAHYSTVQSPTRTGLCCQIVRTHWSWWLVYVLYVKKNKYKYQPWKVQRSAELLDPLTPPPSPSVWPDLHPHVKVCGEGGGGGEDEDEGQMGQQRAAVSVGDTGLSLNIQLSSLLTRLTPKTSGWASEHCHLNSTHPHTHTLRLCILSPQDFSLCYFLFISHHFCSFFPPLFFPLTSLCLLRFLSLSPNTLPSLFKPKLTPLPPWLFQLSAGLIQ